MFAKEVISLIPEIRPSCDFEDFKLRGLSIDSRTVGRDYCFFAIDGNKTDGHNFINAAVNNGARMIVHDLKHESFIKDLDFSKNSKKPIFLAVNNPRSIVGKIAAAFFNNPSENLQVIGITGTNGKTTISFLLEHIFSLNAIKTGVIGTIHYKIADHVQIAKNTTPDAITIHNLLHHMTEHNLTHAIMEVSSHALDQCRVEAVDFKHAVFTNITHDHLDYHRDKEDYFLAKAKLFKSLKKGADAVINVDDEYGVRLKELTKAEVVEYAIENKQAEIRAEQIKLGLDSTEFVLNCPLGKIIIKTGFIGRHNVYNILAAVSVAIKEGIPLESIAQSLISAKCVPGRLEKIKHDRGFQIFVDYAHTEDALKNVLSTLKELKPARIITLFGCGGDRDKKKRPLMGQTASQLSDFLILTNDNPRSETPEEIINDIISGFKPEFKNFEVILDRKKAINQAIAKAQKGDFVLIAGKGHETDQIFKDKKIGFDDRKVAREFLKEQKRIGK